MMTNAGDALRGPWCVLLMAGAMLVNGSCTLNAQEQGAQRTPEVYQTFYLSDSTGQQDANDIQTALRNMLPRAKIYYVATANALSIRGSADDIALTQKMLKELDQPRKTYRLTFTISEGAEQRHFVMVVTPGDRSELKQGSRVPIMTGNIADGKTEHTEIQYMDVGTNIRASLTGLGDGLRLQSKIERTSVAEEKSNVGLQDPVIRQAVLEGDTALSPGRAVVLGQMPDNGKEIGVSVVAELVK